MRINQDKTPLRFEKIPKVVLASFFFFCNLGVFEYRLPCHRILKTNPFVAFCFFLLAQMSVTSLTVCTRYTHHKIPLTTTVKALSIHLFSHGGPLGSDCGGMNQEVEAGRDPKSASFHRVPLVVVHSNPASKSYKKEKSLCRKIGKK